MYDWLSHQVAKISPQHARMMAWHAVRLASLIFTAKVPESLQREVMGLKFPGPVGMAAGFDKHGELYSALTKIGLGFVEIGSVIPEPEHMRSNGLEAVANNLMRYSRPYPVPLGISLSMNRKTPFEQMPEDYLAGMRRLWKIADYFVLNLGVRAGPDLHLSENRETLHKVLSAAKCEQLKLFYKYGLSRPLVVKVDQHRGDTTSLLCCIKDFGFDGVILSGENNQDKHRMALMTLERTVNLLDSIPVISVGGIRTPQDAADHLSAGASLIQIYSGLVASGPMLPQRMNSYLLNRLH